MPSNSNNTVLAIYYDIFISGQKLPIEKKMCIQSITVNETEDGADTATINIVDADFDFVDDNLFIEDVPIKIEAGWHDEMYRFSFNGYIATLDIDFPETGNPVLDIYCMDGTHLMNREKKKRTWEDVSSADVVQIICSEYGLGVVLESGYDFKKEDSIAQSNQTDIEFIQSLAQKESTVFICKLKDNSMYYVKKGLLTEPVSELWYKENTREIISFKPKINKETKQVENERATITSATKEIDKGVASDTQTNREVQGESMKTTNSPTYNSYAYDISGGRVRGEIDWVKNLQESVNEKYTNQNGKDPQRIR